MTVTATLSRNESSSVLPVVLALVAACSSNRRGGEDTDADTGTDLDTDVDTDADSDTASETDSGTETDQGTWSWLEVLPDNHIGMPYQIAGFGADDLLIAGHFVLDPIPPSNHGILFYDGALHVLLGPPGFDRWRGFGACASGSGEYFVYVDELVYHPSFVAISGTSWTDLGLPGGCDEWVPAPAEEGHFAVRRHLTCLDSGGFAALLTCEEPGDVPDPVEPGHHVVVYDGAEWSVLLSFPLEATWPLLIAGHSTDALLVFLDRPADAPGYRFEGGTLMPMTAPPGDWTHLRFLGMADNPGGGFVVVGVSQEGGTEEDVCPKGFAWRSEIGLEWTALEVPLAPDPEYPCEEFRDVWVSGDGELFIVGTRMPSVVPTWEVWPLLLHGAGGWWQEIELPPHPLFVFNFGRFYSVMGFDRTVFVAGELVVDPWEGWPDISEPPAFLKYQPE